MIYHKLTDDGGFAAVDTDRKVAVYAYPSSLGADAYAKLRSQEQRDAFARREVEGERVFDEDISRRHFNHIYATCFPEFLSSYPAQPSALENANAMLPIVADSWSALRGCDVYRLLAICDDYEPAAEVVRDMRPDLQADVREALADLRAIA